MLLIIDIMILSAAFLQDLKHFKRILRGCDGGTYYKLLICVDLP